MASLNEWVAGHVFEKNPHSSFTATRKILSGLQYMRNMRIQHELGTDMRYCIDLQRTSDLAHYIIAVHTLNHIFVQLS